MPDSITCTYPPLLLISDTCPFLAPCFFFFVLVDFSISFPLLTVCVAYSLFYPSTSLCTFRFFFCYRVIDGSILHKNVSPKAIVQTALIFLTFLWRGDSFLGWVVSKDQESRYICGLLQRRAATCLRLVVVWRCSPSTQLTPIHTSKIDFFLLIQFVQPDISPGIKLSGKMRSNMIKLVETEVAKMPQGGGSQLSTSPSNFGGVGAKPRPPKEQLASDVCQDLWVTALQHAVALISSRGVPEAVPQLGEEEETGTGSGGHRLQDAAAQCNDDTKALIFLLSPPLPDCS